MSMQENKPKIFFCFIYGPFLITSAKSVNIPFPELER